jgi:hypothetical protein
MLDVRPAPQKAAHFGPAQDWQIEIENDEVGRTRGDGFERGIAAADDLGISLAAPLERVFDEAGDVVLVFDNQDAMFVHVPTTVLAGGFATVSKLLNVGYVAMKGAILSP